MQSKLKFSLLIVLLPAGTSMSFASANAAVKTKVNKVERQITAITKTIKKGINKSANKKKLVKLKKDRSFWKQVIKEITACKNRVLSPTPTPTPTASSDGGGFVGTISSASFYLLEGATIYSNDGRFLGVFSSNPYSSNSIANTYGNYGSDYAINSMFNDYGTYGSDYSSQSPWSEYTQTPPVIFLGNEPVSYLTANQFKTPRVDPWNMIAWLGRGR